jgi:hypothetical protein
MSGVETHLDDLWIAVGETKALAAVTAESYDRQDWGDADPLHVERLGSLLGLISKSASAAMAALHRLHGAVADAQPAPAGERWDYEGPRHVTGGRMTDHEAEIVRRLREACAAEFKQPIDYPFWGRDYFDGEKPDAALLRMFREEERRRPGRTDDAVIHALIYE